eukprot:scaffold438_cov250-Pinguiococcus_pyrenoidosus.AAC.4
MARSMKAGPLLYLAGTSADPAPLQSHRRARAFAPCLKLAVRGSAPPSAFRSSYPSGAGAALVSQS